MFGRKDRLAPSKREPRTDLEDLRDDCIAVFLDSGMSMKEVHEAGGPTPVTTARWLYRETRFPRFDTIRAMLKALDHDLTVRPTDKSEAGQIAVKFAPKGQAADFLPPWKSPKARELRVGRRISTRKKKAKT